MTLPGWGDAPGAGIGGVDRSTSIVSAAQGKPTRSSDLGEVPNSLQLAKGKREVEYGMESALSDSDEC